MEQLRALLPASGFMISDIGTGGVVSVFVDLAAGVCGPSLLLPFFSLMSE